MSFKFPLQTQQFIHGKYVDSTGTDKITLRSAIDDSIVCEDLQDATAEDVDAAVESAEKGFRSWIALKPEARRAILLKYADLIEKNAEQLCYLETIVVGKPVGFTHAFEVMSAVEAFRYFAGYIDKFEGDLHPTHDGFLRGVTLEPLGVCAAVVSFNSPIITFAMKAAPALTAGNSIITKANETNPFSTLYLAELAMEAGFPAGTLNVVVGGIPSGSALASHMKIRKISFTGSAAVGRKIQIAAAQSNLKRVTLELGGKSPVLIFDDADLAIAIPNSAAFLSLNGQGCVLGTRILVQEGIADQFVGGLKQMVEGFAQTLGMDPFNPQTPSGPLFHARQKKVVMGYLESGKAECTVVTGGNSWGDKGCFVEPTIFMNPQKDAKVWKEEIFGPVVVIDTFKTEEQALQMANDTEYGLGASVYTKDLSRALRVTYALEAGSVSVNTAALVHNTIPFGGSKQSGTGRENAKYVLREYTQPKSITIKY